MSCFTLKDKMHIKEDLVYDKDTGALVGFTFLGDTTEHLLKIINNLHFLFMCIN